MSMDLSLFCPLGAVSNGRDRPNPKAEEEHTPGASLGAILSSEQNNLFRGLKALYLCNYICPSMVFRRVPVPVTAYDIVPAPQWVKIKSHLPTSGVGRPRPHTTVWDNWCRAKMGSADQ